MSGLCWGSRSEHQHEEITVRRGLSKVSEEQKGGLAGGEEVVMEIWGIEAKREKFFLPLFLGA